MPGKKTLRRKHEYVPDSLVRHIESRMKELNLPTRVESMEEIARELDKLVIKKRIIK